MIFVTAYLGGSHGTAKSARDFLRAMLASYNGVKVISPAQEDFPNKLCNQTLSKPIWIGVPSGVRLPRRVWRIRLSLCKSWLEDLRKQHKLVSLLSNNETVIVNGWASYSYWLSIENKLKNCRFNGRKIIIVRESPRHFSDNESKIELSNLINCWAKFDKLIFVSKNVCKEWLSFSELSNKNSFYLPNCCEEEEIEQQIVKTREEIRHSLGLSSQEFVVFCPGPLIYRKGQDILLNILPDLVSQIPNIRILLVGDVVSLWGKKLLSAFRTDIEKGILIHLQSRPTIIDIMYASDVLAFPSRAEAMPRTVLEAMALKVPVVAAAVDGVPELIENLSSGILFDSNNSKQLLDGILKIANDPHFSEALVERAYIRYWTQFSRINQFRRIQEILSDEL